MKINKHKHKRDGRWIDDYEVEDGSEVRVPIMLADSAPRKWPGWVSPLSDAEVKLLDQHKSGFRTTDQITDHQAKAGTEIARDGVRSAREAYLRDLNSAWKLDKRKPPDTTTMMMMMTRTTSIASALATAVPSPRSAGRRSRPEIAG
jgi:hypothetical protein